MPTYYSYTPMFSEPVNWGDNYGSRIRGYFVPQQSGQHVFFIGEEAYYPLHSGLFRDNFQYYYVRDLLPDYL